MIKRELVVKANDFHVPEHDPSVIRAFLAWIKEYKPSKIMVDEMFDFYQISSFSKDVIRIASFEEEIEICIDIITEIRKIAGKNCEINMLKSNHDKRLEKYLLNKSPELQKLKCLTVIELLKLKQNNINYYDDYVYKNVLFKHGGIVRKESAMSAKAESEKEGMNGCSGHTHRLGQYYKTLRGYSAVWLECGCLCKTKNVKYIEGTPNWQNGFGFYSFKKNSNHFTPGIVPIINGEIYYNEKEFK